GVRNEQLWHALCAGAGEEAAGDFAAQVSANLSGVTRLQALIKANGLADYTLLLAALNDYAERLAGEAIAAIPPGDYHFRDYMDDDGVGARRIPIDLILRVLPSGPLASKDDE